MKLSANNLLKGRYRIESVLGQGGMGAVYKATDELLGIPVAVKENLFLSDEFTKQFKQETRILAGLRHPNLPRVLDFCSIEGQGQYLIMDYIGGEDLRDLLKRSGPLTEKDVVLIGYHICEALDYMHSQENLVVHRDVKPGNIKLTATNEVLLVDFGLAKQTSSRSQMTMTGARAMTPGFSPPEQYGTARTDERSDIYSLGATLYNALTGFVPEDALDRVTDRNDLTPILNLRRDTERRLVKVIEKAMALKPEDRFQSAKEFQKALLLAARMQSVQDDIHQLHQFDFSQVSTESSEEEKLNASGSRKSRSSMFFPQRKRNWIGAAFLMLLIISAIGLLSFRSEWLLERISVLFATQVTSSSVGDIVPATTFLRPTISSTVEPAESVPSATEIIPTNTPSPTVTFTEEPTVSLTATITAINTEEPTITPTIIYTETVVIAGIQDLYPIVFASNRSGTNQLWLMDEFGQEKIQLTNMSSGACQPAWSPDGAQIVFISPCQNIQDHYTESILYVYSFEDQSIIPFLEVDAVEKTGNFNPDWSPDGKTLAYTARRDRINYVYTYSVKDKSINTLTDQEQDSFQPAWHPDGNSIIFVRDDIYATIWQVSRDGSGLIQVSKSRNVDDYHPVWDRTGRFILYSQLDSAQVPWLVKFFTANFGTNLEDRITVEGVTGTFPILAPVFTESNDMIIFESWPDGRNHDIYRMNIDGTGLERLTTSSAYDFDPDYFDNRIVVSEDGEIES